MANWKKALMASAGGDVGYPVDKMVYPSQGNASNRSISQTHDLDTTNGVISYGVATPGANNNYYYNLGWAIGDQRNSMGIAGRMGGGSSTDGIYLYFYNKQNSLRGTRYVSGNSWGSGAGVQISNRLMSGQLHKDRNEAIFCNEQTGEIFTVNTVQDNHNYSYNIANVPGAKNVCFNSYVDYFAVNKYGGGQNYYSVEIYTPNGSSGAIGSTNGTDGIGGYTHVASVTHPGTSVNYGLYPGAAIEGTNYHVFYSKSSASGSYYSNGVWNLIYDMSNPSSPSYTGYSWQSEAVDYYAIFGYSETAQTYFVLSNRSSQQRLYLRVYDLSTISSPSLVAAHLLNTSDYYTNTYSQYSEPDQGLLIGTKPTGHSLLWGTQNSNGSFSFTTISGGANWWRDNTIVNWGSNTVTSLYEPRGLIGIY